MKRRDFLKSVAIGGSSVSLLSLPLTGKSKLFAQDAPAQVAWIENGEPAELLHAAMKELGGMKSFISPGDVVVVKPNIGWDRNPAIAATTNPDLVAEIVKQCFAAGAEEVKVFDHTCNNPQRCYRNSKIEAKAKEAGADVIQMRKNKYTDYKVNGKAVNEWPIYEDYLEADKTINVPIAKHHSLSRVTLGLKNLMGVMGGNRGAIHNDFAQKLTDIGGKILPTLTIIDAYRILTENGPVGGNPDHVKMTKTVIASPCTISADYVALDLFGHKLEEVEHIKVAAEQGLAKFDLNSLNVKKVALG